MSLGDLLARLMDDMHSDEREDPVKETLGDLEAAGYATDLNAGWRMTKKGLEQLRLGLPAEVEPPPLPVEEES